MASKNQDVHLRIYMDANEAVKSMAVIAQRMGELKDKIKSMRNDLKSHGLGMTATAEDLEKHGLDRGLITSLKRAEEEEKVLKKITKQASVSIKDFNKIVEESTKMTRAELETTLKQIEKRFNTFHPANEKDKANMLELQHLYEAVRVELEKRNVKQMTGADAIKVYNQAQLLMKQGAQADAQALREVAAALGRAKEAQGISIADSRKYAQAQIEVNEVLKARGAVFVDTAKSAETLQNAQRLLDLSKQGKSDVSLEEAAKNTAIQRRVDAEKQLVQAQQSYTDGLKALDEKHEKAAQKREAHLQKEMTLQAEVNAARAALPPAAAQAYDDYKEKARQLEILTQKQNEYAAAHKQQMTLANQQRAMLDALETDIAEKEQQLAAAQAEPNPNQKNIAKLTQEIGDYKMEAETMKSTLVTLRNEEERLNSEYAKAKVETKACADSMKTLEQSWKSSADAVKKLQDAEKALNDFQAKGLKTGMADSTYEKKKKALEEQVRVAKENLELQKQNEEESIRVYEQAVKNGGIDIATLREMYKELEFVRDHTKDEKTVNSMTNTLRDMKQRIDELAKARVNEKEVASRAQALIEQGGKAEVTAIKRTIEDLKILANQEGVTAENAKKYNEQISKLEGLTKNVSAGLRRIEYDGEFVAQTIKNIRFANQQDLEKVMLMLRDRMKDAQINLKEYIDTSIRLKTVQAQVRSMNSDLKQQGDWFSTNAKKLMNYLGVFGGFYLVRQELTKFFQASMKYDDQLTDIQKTTNLTDKGIRLMADGIKHIETRTSIEELQNLGYQAGKLGVNGVSDLLGFVRAADMLRVSLGEQLGEDAAEKLMKIANIMGDTDSYGLEEALTRTGSAITYMAKNSAASGDAIVAFMSRTAGLSRQAGITSSELTGLAAAVSALGQPVEMSATSFSKMMVQMEKSYKTVGAALKMTDREMETLRLNLESGRGMEAFLDMLKRVKEMGGLSSTASIAKDLGSEGSRVIQTLTTLSSSYETIARMVHQSTEAFEENITVQDEYKKKNENTAALYEKLKNNFNKLFVSQEANDWLRGLMERLQVLPGAVQQLIDNFKGLASIVGNFTINHITGLVNALSSLLYLLGARSIARSVGGALLNVAVSIKVVADNIHTSAIPAIQKYNLALQGNIGFWKRATLHAQKFFAICKAASIGNALFTVVSVLTVIYQLFLNNEKEIKNWSDSTVSAVDRVKKAADETTEKMEELIKAHSAANLSQEEDLRIREQLQDMFGDYLGNLDLEKEAWENIETAVRGANEQLQANQILEATKAHIKDIRKTDSEEQAPEYGKLLEQVKKRLTSTDEQTLENQAVAIVNAMMRNPDMYVGAKDSSGQFTKNKYYSGALNPEEYKIQSNLNTLFRSIAGEAFKPINQILTTYVTNADNARERHRQGEDVDFVDEFQDLFVPFANSLDNTEKSVHDAMVYGNAQAAEHVKAAMEWMKPMMDAQYKLFSNSLSRGGAFNPETVRKERSSKDAQDATTDDWARDKRGVLDSQRNFEAAAAKSWLNFAQNYLKDMRSQNGENPDTAEITAMQNQISNVKAWLKIWDIGNNKNLDPDADKKAREAARVAKQEMDNLIQKIKTFYEIQAKAYKEMRQKQQITETEYQRYLEQNNRDMSASLADAYAALAQDADMTEERYKQITERMRQENKRSGAGEIGETQIGIVSDTSYASVQNINKQLSGDKENGTAWTNSMRRKRREEEGNVIESLNKEMQARIKAWLEQNPLGKIAQDFQKQFEEMGLLIHIKPEVDADGVEIRNLDQVQNDLMKQMLEIGRTVSAYNVTTAEGRKEFAAYVKDLEKFPDVARTVVMETDTDISSFYYKIYEYAEQYEEQMKRLTDRTMKMWTKMYADTPAHRAIQEELNGLALLQKRYTELEKFGLHQRFNMDANVRKAQLEYDNAIAALEDKAARARAHMASAQALKVGDKTTDGTDVTAQFRDAEIASAQAEIDALQSEGQQVVEIYGKVIDAQAAVREATYEWVASMKDAFAKFADGFAPFRSWYEEKGSPALNIFGTKSERQEAFGQFMDDLKKLVRAALMEQMQLKMSKWLNLPDKADAYSKSSSKPAEDAVGNIIGKSDAEVDIVSLEENKTSELDVIKASNYQKEEEARRHKAEMDAIESGSSTGNVMDEDTKSSLKARAFAEEMSIEQAMEEQKLNMKAAAEQSLQNLAMQGIQKMLKQKQKAAKEEFKITKLSAKDRTKIEEEANEETGESAIGLAGIQAQISERIKNIRIDNSKETAAQEQSDDVTSAGVSMWGSFGGAVAKAWEEGGPYLGPVLAAVVSAAVGSLITWVMNMMGSSSKSASAAPKTKLVSGMLTYDSGNVQSFRGIPTYDGGGSAPKNINMLPVMGDDGRVYMVPEGDMMGKNNMSGFTGIVRRPTLTTVGGAPALVAERGPEMVIGRETTHAMMMSRPDLLRAIVEFDRNRSRGFVKTFDSGNVSQLATVPEASPEGNNSQLMEVLDAQTAMLSQMYEINAALTAELRKGIGVRKYGAGGLIEETAAGFAEARRLGNNKNVTQLFGSR